MGGKKMAYGVSKSIPTIRQVKGSKSPIRGGLVRMAA